MVAEKMSVSCLERSQRPHIFRGLELSKYPSASSFSYAGVGVWDHRRSVNTITGHGEPGSVRLGSIFWLEGFDESA